MDDVPWSLHLLAELLATFSVDDPDALEHVLDRVAESVDAEVAAIQRGGVVSPAVGLTGADVEALGATAADRPAELRVAAGLLHMHWAPLGDGLLLVGRLDEPFDLEERSLLRAMARSLELSTAVIDAVASERATRAALDRALADAVHQATHDRLTGLPGRAHVLRQLAERMELARAHPDRPMVCALFIDVDRFKQVNDALGHATGDRFLTVFAERLREVTRTADLVGRLAGDEFVVISEQDDLEEVDRYSERLVRDLSRPVEVDGRQIVSTVSVGVAVSADAADAEGLVDSADLAMYAAKQRGRGRAVRFDQGLRAAARERAGIEAELRRAVAEGRLGTWFQPVVDLGDGGIVGFEALARWHDPVRGMVPPDVFVPVAEESGLIADVDALALRVACRQVAAWNDRRPGRPLSVSVNVSARSFGDPTLPLRVAAELATSGLDPDQLFLEITESVMMEETAGSSDVLRGLTDLGVRLAVDDFGTGYSSLRYLKTLPVGVLKIDRSFTDGLGHDHEDEVIVEAVIGLARSLGLAVTAEGVETATQATMLRRMGCPMAQGFLFGRPAPADVIEALLADTVPVGAYRA